MSRSSSGAQERPPYVPVAPESSAISGGSFASTQDDEVFLLRLVNVLLRRRWLIVGIVTVLFLTTVVPPLVRGGRSYAAVTTFVTEAEQGGANLSGLAAQFGLDVAGGTGGNSPQFYVDLLESPFFLKQVVETPYSVETDTGRIAGTLVELYNVDREHPPGVRTEIAVQQLAQATEAVLEQRTGVIELTVSNGEPRLAARIAERMLELLDEFNRNTRRSRATAERRFLEERVREVRAELRSAEAALQTFLQGNRDYMRSPALSFQYERLQRESALRQQLYSTLVQRYEETRIEEVRDTPVLSVLDPPDVPVLPEPRKLIQKGLIAIGVGLAVGVLLAFIADFALGVRVRGGSDAREFSRLLGDVAADIRRPWRHLRRRTPAA